MELYALHLRGTLYAVRPAGQLGTCGFYPCAWTVHYVHAKSAAHALARSRRSTWWEPVRDARPERSEAPNQRSHASRTSHGQRGGAKP